MAKQSPPWRFRLLEVFFNKLPNPDPVKLQAEDIRNLLSYFLVAHLIYIW